MTPNRLIVLALVVCGVLAARVDGGHAAYVGGTIAQIPSGCDGLVQATDPQYFGQ